MKESTTPSDLFSGPVNIKWEGGAPTPLGCVGHTAVWLNGVVYLGGGNEGPFKPSFTINRYDSVKNSWSSPINTTQCYFVLTTLNKRLIIAGGQKGDK